jgi:hypothetical protein
MSQTIGQGIADGADNFIKMYFLTKDRNRQEKLEKIRPAIEAIQAQLKDDTIPLDARKELLGTLEHVYAGAGIKISLPKGQTLADLIMPQHVLDQFVDTGETTTENAVNAVPEGASQTDNITTSPVQIPLQKRRGDLSQAEIGIGLQRKANRAQLEDSADITTKRQKEFALYNFNLQKQLQDSGFTKNPEEVMEPISGRTWSVYTNPAGVAKYVPLGAYHSDRGELLTQPTEDTIPVSTYNAREKAKGSGSGLPSTMKALIFETSRELGLPSDDDTVLNRAAEKYREQYSARTSNLNLGTTKGTQATTGTEPIQPAEQARIDAENKRFVASQNQYRASVQARIDEAQPDIDTANEEINSIQSQIDTYQSQITDLVKNQGYETEDDEVVKVQKEVDNLTKQQNAAKKRKGTAEGRKDKAIKELSEFDKIYNSSSSSPSSAISDEAEKVYRTNPKIKAAMDKVKRNAKNKQGRVISNTDAYNILRNNGYIQ